ncbi:unnamed protein product [Cylicocyclus nassatus]|uniref:Uncharacterized protein n=1 Tax=Cylicocyclus nassatus TaxID=53992 RepID=A0AA36GG79_CYLNA|nr:unnamed protein product [Cylicocyclus nassatus]
MQSALGPMAAHDADRRLSNGPSRPAKLHQFRQMLMIGTLFSNTVCSYDVASRLPDSDLAIIKKNGIELLRGNVTKPVCAVLRLATAVFQQFLSFYRNYQTFDGLMNSLQNAASNCFTWQSSILLMNFGVNFVGLRLFFVAYATLIRKLSNKE